jgi:transglutaminase-like putative cysteine protease
MLLSVGCTLGYVVATPNAAFTFNVLAYVDGQQRLVEELITCTPTVGTQKIEYSKGGRVLRCEVPAGPFELQYRALVDVVRPPLPAEIRPDSPGRLPLSILTHTLPSRYCESDRFGPIAWDLFGRTEDRVAQVRAICAWLDANMVYTPGASDSRTSAWDVWQTRKGVCRDYTHLAIALCRALSIPARYVGGYAVGLNPMDFHACFEAYLGGSWQLFDPTDSIDPAKIVVISRGRDAASAALTTIFGRFSQSTVSATCAIVSDAPGAAQENVA